MRAGNRITLSVAAMIFFLIISLNTAVLHSLVVTQVTTVYVTLAAARVFAHILSVWPASTPDIRLKTHDTLPYC